MTSSMTSTCCVCLRTWKHSTAKCRSGKIWHGLEQVKEEALPGITVGSLGRLRKACGNPEQPGTARNTSSTAEQSGNTWESLGQLSKAYGNPEQPGTARNTSNNLGIPGRAWDNWAMQKGRGRPGTTGDDWEQRGMPGTARVNRRRQEQYGQDRKGWECLEYVDILEQPGPTRSKRGQCGGMWNNVEERGKMDMPERPGPMWKNVKMWKIVKSVKECGDCERM